MRHIEPRDDLTNCLEQGLKKTRIRRTERKKRGGGQRKKQGLMQNRFHINLLPFWQWSSSDSKYKLSPITSKEAVRELSFNLHHLFASKESRTACHADLNFPSELWTSTKDGGVLFSGEKPIGVLLGKKEEVVRKDDRKEGNVVSRDQRKAFWEVT